MQYTATSFDVTLNPATDQAVGVTGANRPVQGYFSPSSGGNLLTSCSGNSRCASTTANGAGDVHPGRRGRPGARRPGLLLRV